MTNPLSREEERDGQPIEIQRLIVDSFDTLRTERKQIAEALGLPGDAGVEECVEQITSAISKVLEIRANLQGIDVCATRLAKREAEARRDSERLDWFNTLVGHNDWDDFQFNHASRYKDIREAIDVAIAKAGEKAL